MHAYCSSVYLSSSLLYSLRYPASRRIPTQSQRRCGTVELVMFRVDRQARAKYPATRKWTYNEIINDLIARILFYCWFERIRYGLSNGVQFKEFKCNRPSVLNGNYKNGGYTIGWTPSTITGQWQMQETTYLTNATGYYPTISVPSGALPFNPNVDYLSAISLGSLGSLASLKQYCACIISPP